MLFMADEDKSLNINSAEEIPLYERPGRLDPDRHVPITRMDRVDVNVHYDEDKKEFVKDSDTPEFTDRSVNAMDPFEDEALLSGEIKPKSTGIKTGAARIESKIFVPETDTEEVKAKVKETADELPFKVYVAEEDIAASEDVIADAMSGVETVEPAKHDKPSVAGDDISRIKFLIYLIAAVIVVEIAGIALLIFL